MIKAVSLGELLHEEALFGLTVVRKVGVPRGRLFPSGLCLSAISRVVWAWPDPLPTGLNGDGKNVQTLWWAELDRLHSMTRAHPPLGIECTTHEYTLTADRSQLIAFHLHLETWLFSPDVHIFNVTYDVLPTRLYKELRS